MYNKCQDKSSIHLHVLMYRYLSHILTFNEKYSCTFQLCHHLSLYWSRKHVNFEIFKKETLEGQLFVTKTTEITGYTLHQLFFIFSLQ